MTGKKEGRPGENGAASIGTTDATQSNTSTSADDFARAINWVAENLHDDKPRYRRHPLQQVRDRIDEIRAERGLPPFKEKPRNGAVERVDLWIAGKRAQAPRATTPPTHVAAAGTNPAYVKAAIDAEFAKLAAATEGHRNDELHRVACNVFEFVKAGHVDHAAADAELARIAAATGLDDAEIARTMRSAWDRTSPRAVPAPSGIVAAYTITAEETDQ